MLVIPEPCHEDFSKMTPTQRGAFCGKCQIDTFDFRTLSDQQVNKVLLENKHEHLCGQFTVNQLKSLNRGYLNWKNQKEKTFRSKFVLALILVFGLSLFSCDTEEQNAIVELNVITLMQTDSKLDFVNDVMEEEDFDLTDFLAQENKDESIESRQISVVNGEIAMPGMIAYYPVEEVPQNVEPDLSTRGDIVLERPYRTLGGAMVSTCYVSYLEETLEDSVQEIKVPTVNNKTIHFEAKVYPNPTLTVSNLAIEVETQGQFTISVYDMSGQLIQQVYNGELVVGRQNFQLDISDQPSGIYLVKVLSNEQNETLKLQKLTQ